MKKAISLRMLLSSISNVTAIGFIISLLCTDVVDTKASPEITIEPVTIETIEIEEPEPVEYLSDSDFEKLYSCNAYLGEDTCYSPTIEEAEMLMKLARCEAGDLGIDAQLAVMNVVINRLKDERFPDTISEIVFAAGQFAVITNGEYKKATPNSDSHVALARLEAGEDITNGALYFESASNSKYSWHSQNREFIFEKYGQRFYR